MLAVKCLDHLLAASPPANSQTRTIHWVSADRAVDAEVRLYDHLFTKPDPDEVPEGQDYRANLNSKSLEILTGCKLEPSLLSAKPGTGYQFERLGYFCVELVDSSSQALVFNRAVTLRDTWTKIEKGRAQKK